MKILVVDDDKTITSFLKRILEAENFTVDTAGDGQVGSFYARTNEYDLIILDNVMPKKSGMEVCRDIRLMGKHTPILMLSVKTDIDDKVLLLESGADDYIAKPHSHRELMARIRALLRRPSIALMTKLIANDLILDTETQELWLSGREIYLTRKEFLLLELLMRHKNKVISRGMIMEHVWDMEGDPLSKTIETHILNLRNKIEKGKKKVIENIPGRGYRVRG